MLFAVAYILVVFAVVAIAVNRFTGPGPGLSRTERLRRMNDRRRR